MTGDVGRWFPTLRDGPGDERPILFCVPHAGGSAPTYRQLGEQILDHVDVAPVQLPGRWTRFREPPITDLHVVAAILGDLIPTASGDRPFALFGHSLGALIAFETARLLATAGRAPEHLVVAARGAPQHRMPHRPKISDLPDDRFCDAIEAFGGTPPGLLRDERLFRQFLATLRADFAMVEDYELRSGDPLPCAITVLAGRADPLVPTPSLDGWAEHTRRTCRIRFVDGDHFFVQVARPDLVDAVVAALHASEG